MKKERKKEKVQPSKGYSLEMITNRLEDMGYDSQRGTGKEEGILYVKVKNKKIGASCTNGFMIPRSIEYLSKEISKKEGKSAEKIYLELTEKTDIYNPEENKQGNLINRTLFFLFTAIATIFFIKSNTPTGYVINETAKTGYNTGIIISLICIMGLFTYKLIKKPKK